MEDLNNYVKLRNIEGKLLVRMERKHRDDEEEKDFTPESKTDEVDGKLGLDYVDDVIKKIGSETPIVDNDDSKRKTPESEKESDHKKKGILKYQRTYSNKHVDFNMDLEFVPFDETKDYTIEIQIVEQMPKKIVSYAALFAQQKKEEEDRKIEEEKLKKQSEKKENQKHKNKRMRFEGKKFREQNEHKNKKSVEINHQSGNTACTKETDAKDPETEEEMDDSSDEESFSESSYTTDNEEVGNSNIIGNTERKIKDETEIINLSKQHVENINIESVKLLNDLILLQPDFMVEKKNKEQNVVTVSTEKPLHQNDDKKTDQENSKVTIKYEAENSIQSQQNNELQNCEHLIEPLNDPSLLKPVFKSRTENVKRNALLFNADQLLSQHDEKITELENFEETILYEAGNISLSEQSNENQNTKNILEPSNELPLMQTDFKGVTEEEEQFNLLDSKEMEAHYGIKKSEHRNHEQKIISVGENRDLIDQYKGKHNTELQKLSNCLLLLETSSKPEEIVNEFQHVGLLENQETEEHHIERNSKRQTATKAENAVFLEQPDEKEKTDSLNLLTNLHLPTDPVIEIDNENHNTNFNAEEQPSHHGENKIEMNYDKNVSNIQRDKNENCEIC